MMNKLYLSGLIFLCPFLSFSQNHLDKNCQYPTFPNGGEQAFWQYLKENVRYPEASRVAGTEGVLKIKFLIDEKGSVMDIAIQEGISKEIDAEAIRLIQNMPQWTPGKMGNNTLRASYLIPIIFKIEDSKKLLFESSIVTK